MSMVFQEPPYSPKRERIGRWSYDWDMVMKKIKERPGEWLLLDSGAKVSIATALRESKIKAMRADLGVQVTQAHTDRSVAPATADIYVRYWPEQDDTLTDKERRRLMKSIEDKEEKP